MESGPPTTMLPDATPIEGESKDTVLAGGPPAPLCPSVAATVAQTGKEEILSVSPTYQTEPPPQGAGLVFITGREEDYKPETGRNTELIGNEHTGGNVLTQAPSHVSPAALSSPPLPQSSVGFTVQDAVVAPVHHIRPSESAEPACSHQDSNPSDGQIKELLENADGIAVATSGIHTVNSLEAVERVEVLFETQPHSEVLETPKAKEPLSGLYPEAPSSPLQTDASPEASKAPDTPALFDGGLVVSLQSGDVVKAETSHSIAELVHSADAQEIVVVREEAHISGAWTNVHLNQSYLLQREDGSVCEASIELAAAGGVQAEVELDSQPMEVYEFCGLVEEVAEETVCGGGGGAHIPHSPGYEVNLFNALLDNSDEYTVKEDLEGDTIIISQQGLPSASNVTRIQTNNGSHSLQDGEVATVEQHLVLDQAVELAHSSEVCLVEVATVAVSHTESSEPAVAAALCSQAGDSAGLQMVPSAAAPPSATEETAAGVQVPPLHQTQGVTVVSAAKPEVCVSSHEGTKEASALTNTESLAVQTVATESKAKSHSISYASIDPKRLLLRPGDSPLLRVPAALLKSVAGKLANAHSSGTGPEECLLQAAATATASSSSAAGGSGTDQAPCSQMAVSGNAPLQLHQTSEALTITAPESAAPLTHMAASPPHDHESRGDSLSGDEECEDMEQDEAGRDPEAREAHSGQVSSPEEGSDDDDAADADKSEMTSPSSPLKVRQWISDRVSIKSSPILPSTSSAAYPGPSHSPSPGPSDWSTPRREKLSPLRGPHGKFVSPSSLGGYSSTSSPTDQSTPQRPRGERHTDMAELAKHEADIEHRTQALKREGFWSTKRLTRLTEPQKPKVHWDYLCEEMQWLSADFAQERRWKRGVARKVVRMVMRHHEELRQKEEKAKRDEQAKIRRVASSIAKEVRAFWSNVEKVVQYKQQSRLEEKRKKALDLQLDFIVGQTEKYSDLLSKSLAPSRPAEAEAAPTSQKSAAPAVDEDDRDFEPPCEEEDDEETIEVEEQQEGNDAETHRREIELLKEEGLLPLDQLISTLKLPQDLGSEEECSDETSSSAGEEEEQKEEDEDGEFAANEEDSEDEEDTIAAQEKVEGNVNHAEELDDLAREGDMSMEELLEKYKGAYASDFEAPSASASGSKASSDIEDSGDDEAETEEDESDVESNTSSSDSAGDSAEDESEKEEGESEEDEEGGDEGMEVLLKEGDHSPPSSSSRPKKEISHIAATAESLQPKGYTLATTKVKTPIPFLLYGTLREYQHIGLDWLVTMYEKKLNGILADEMGLGKTIQTIALLAHLACEKGNWGPHLIIVPTSVMLNWEMELKRWCPGFKILTYFGSQKERKLKRQGWTKPNAFHVCITSYKLVLQDHQAFRRKSWRYLILDEAQNIKNFKSQRWQSLLNFNSHRRLLLTGTPLQNSLMELWSLMHFLMPHVFQSHREFKEWFSNPLTGMIEGSQEYNEGLVKRLHKVLRPFLLRRIKVDVEKQMPKKYEHVVRCRLSKRQRFLYDDFMAQASTRETLASGHFMSVINILMQLRKVCNHPNLFDPRPIQSPFITQPIIFHTASLVQDALDVCPLKRCDLSIFNLVALERRMTRYQADVFLPRHKVSRQLIQEIMESPEPPPRPRPVRMKVNRMFQPPPKGDNRPVLLMNKPTCSVAPATQTPKPPPVTEVASTPAPPPVVQQVVCSVSTAPPPRPTLHPASQTAVRSSAPKPVLTVRPPTVPCAAGVPAHPSPNPGAVMPQRVLLSPDMQARLPSGEVVSIAQLASLAGRPVSSCQGSKPVTFQLQGNKLTLSGAQIHQVPTAATPRPIQGNVMHLVSSGVQHHLISQPAQVTVQSTTNTLSVNTASTVAPPANRLPHNAASQVPSSMVSSPGVVKIVVRQSAGKEGGPVPTLAVAPSPRVTPQASPSLHPHANTTPIRTAAPLQITQRTSGPATAHYTIAPPRIPSSTPNQPQPPRPILKVVQPPPPPPPPPPTPPAGVEQPASTPVTSSSSVSKSSSMPRDSSSSQTTVTPKSRPGVGVKACPPPRRVPRPPPRSPFHMSWLSDSLKQQRESRLDFIFGVNERRCGARPLYGREVLDFLTFLPGSRPSPALLRPKADWGRSGHSSCLLAQTQNQLDLWQQSRAVRGAIHSVEDRLELLADVIDRFTFVIPPVEAPPISMHCCHPPPSLSNQQAVFTATLATEAAPLTGSLHRVQCYMRTQFPDLRLIQYDCGKLQTLHTLLRKLKTGGHRVLIFTQMTRMLDVLEQFLNYHGHIYLRLDGSTRVEQRQALMERFNADRRIFCFILSTRSGGVGVNLTGADTVVFYDSDWNPTMDAQAQDRCHRIGQTRDVHIYRLISERTVEENILKKANQKRMLGDMAIEGGNFTTAFFKQQTIRELFDMNDGEKREAAVELSLPHAEEDEGVNKQSTTILEQALCRAEDEEDIVAASQAKAEQVAELAEFNENIPLDDGGEQEEVEELSKAEQEIAALVEQLTPIERYAMNFLEASLEDVCKEELKQAEEQVEAARKGLDQAKEEGLKLHASSDDDDNDFLSRPSSTEPAQPPPSRRGRKPKDKTVTSTRTSGRLRGASPDTEPEPATPREVPERLRGLRGRGAAKDTSAVSTTPSHPKTSSSARLQDSKSSKASSPARDHHTVKTRTQPNRTHPSPVPSPATTSPPAGKHPTGGDSESKNSKAGRDEKDGNNESKVSESSLDSSCPVDHQTKDDDSKDHSAMSPPSTSSRSPRKRQSADDEVLRGLVEDSPSAKVLRKLPGRLVTVVEEKEPRRRRRRGSGTGGSLEEATAEESADEPNKDNTSLSSDSKTKATVTKSPQDQDPSPSPSVIPQPVRSYPPYSPPHLSPDMPVLRNLPVRRRLETESRLAAQLGEQQQQLLLGRGRGGNQSKKTDSMPGKEATSGATESSLNSFAAPLKRKRGRPPKTSPRLLESDNTVSPMPMANLPREDEKPPLSPKRKRGRPRKDSVTASEPAGEGQNPGASAVSKLELSSDSVLSETPTPVNANTNTTSPSTKAEEMDTKTVGSNVAPNQALIIKTDEACKPLSASTQARATLELSPVPTSSQIVISAQDAQASSSPAPMSSCTTVPVTTTPLLPSTSIVSSTTPTSGVTTASEAAVEPVSSTVTVKPTGLDSNFAKPTTVATPAATTPPAVSDKAAVPVSGVMKPATTTVKLVTTETAADKDPMQSAVASAAATIHAIPKLPSTSLSSTSPKPTSSASVPVMTTEMKAVQPSSSNLTTVKTVQTNQSNPTTIVKPTQANPSSPTAVKAPQICSSNQLTTVKTAQTSPLNQTTVKAPQTNLSTPTTTLKTAQTSPSSLTTKVKTPQAGSTNPTATEKTLHVGPSSPITEKTPQAGTPVKEKPAQACPSNQTIKTIQLCPSVSTTQTKPVQAFPSKSAALATVQTSQENASPTMPSVPSSVKVNTTLSLHATAKTTVLDTKTLTTPSATKVSALTQSAKEPLKPSAAPPLQICSAALATSAPAMATSALAPAPATSVSAPATSAPASSVSAPATSAPATSASVPALATSVPSFSEADTATPTLSSETKTIKLTSSKLDTSGSSLMVTPEEKTPKTPVMPSTGVPQTVSTPKIPSLEKSAADQNRNSATTTSATASITAVTTAAPPASISQTTVQMQNPGSTGVSASAPTGASSETQSADSMPENSKSDSEMEVDTDMNACEQKDNKQQDVCKSQPKRRKVESSSVIKESKTEREEEGAGDEKVSTSSPKDLSLQSEEKTYEDHQPQRQKRSLSRQSSQDSTRSSSPSSGCSTSTLTRHAHHKRTYENRHPAKKKRTDVTSETGKEEKFEESGDKKVDGSEESTTSTSRSVRRSRSSSSSTDSESEETRKENRLTRSAKRRLQDQEKDKGTKERKASKPAHSSDKSTSNTNNTSTGGESGSDTSSVRITRKSSVSQPSQDGKIQTNSTPPLPPEPEVLGKRCSALNAAAKLLAMKGRVDTPGHTTRRDSGAKSASSVEKNPKPKSKGVPTTPQSNSVSLNNNKNSGGKPSTPNQTSRSSSRSTRQCPGSLVPPLEAEYKRPKPEDKERGSRKSSGGKEGDGEGQSSSRGHSACSSMSSDGEGDCGGRSSRSRSSSNSSQRTHSISSQNTERRSSRSRAASSGSEREQDRSLERAKSKDKRDRQGHHRESRKDGRRSQKLPQEAVTSGSGNEGTLDRVLRSVTALAAVQARSPAASTRSSSSHQRHNKT